MKPDLHLVGREPPPPVEAAAAGAARRLDATARALAELHRIGPARWRRRRRRRIAALLFLSVTGAVAALWALFHTL